eukprot:5867770-Pleurochrysis_carterae.AAC.1
MAHWPRGNELIPTGLSWHMSKPRRRARFKPGQSQIFRGKQLSALRLQPRGHNSSATAAAAAATAAPSTPRPSLWVLSALSSCSPEPTTQRAPTRLSER